MAAFSLLLCSAVLRSVWLGEAAKMSLPEPRVAGQEGTQGREMENGAPGTSCSVFSLGAASEP